MSLADVYDVALHICKQEESWWCHQNSLHFVVQHLLGMVYFTMSFVHPND